MITSQNCICIMSLKIDVMLIQRNQTKYFQNCHHICVHVLKRNNQYLCDYYQQLT